MLAELSFSSIADCSALSDIHDQLVKPAIDAGYRHIWLAGISIGGYVAIAYAQHYPDVLQGLVLLAPYPGNRSTISEILASAEIQASGGINGWNSDTIAVDDTERGNWYWLKNYALQHTEVYLGYGEQDRFMTGHTLMAAALPAINVDVISGDHSWPVWLQLWQRFLDKNLIAKIAN